jgi:mono/diheme cytochrome c family protein
MSYPFWDIELGYGVMMAIIAVVHVFVSHFAIGGGLYLVVAETSARRANDQRRLDYLRSLSKFFILLTLVFGALTGVGIWFIIGLLNPAATEVLIHHFVWAWAIEWTFFAVEIAAAILYFYGWGRMTPRAHLALGWIYFAAAWLSLVVINGIICFMLTPGDWLTTGGFWDGFFNPTFWPSVVLRTGICLLLAGVYAMLVAARLPSDAFKGSLVRYNAAWSILGIAFIVPGFFWYWNAAIPEEIVAQAKNVMTLPVWSIQVGAVFLGLLAFFVVVFGLLIPRRMHVVVAACMMVLGLGFFGGFEWMRESIRKPYVIHGFMYGNSVEVALADSYQADGYLPHITYRSGDDGADLFRHLCRSCHTLNGYQPLGPAFSGTDPEFIAGMVRGTGAMRVNMPPFLGTSEEADLIGAEIWKGVDTRPLEEITGLSGVELGEVVYEMRCGRCHEFGGHQDVGETVTAMDADELGELLDIAEEMDELMPAFTGDEMERATLIEYVLSRSREGGD